MRGMVRYIVGNTYKPFLVKYLSKTRAYSYKGIHLQVLPEVFHPGFFSSTKLLLHYISKYSLAKKTFLELGAGSGLLSICAAKRGAVVTATDINPVALSCVDANAGENNVEVRTVRSDVFDDISQETFDFILINPPYYKKNPSSFSEYAWYCGKNGEYFQKLFRGLHSYVNKTSKVLMVLCDGCDLKMIQRLARENDCSMQCVFTKQTLIEKNYIFKIQASK